MDSTLSGMFLFSHSIVTYLKQSLFVSVEDIRRHGKDADESHKMSHFLLFTNVTNQLDCSDGKLSNRNSG